MQVEPLF